MFNQYIFATIVLWFVILLEWKINETPNEPTFELRSLFFNIDLRINKKHEIK